VITVYVFDIDMTRIEHLKQLQQKMETGGSGAVYYVVKDLLEMLIQDELKMRSFLQSTGATATEPAATEPAATGSEPASKGV